MLGKWDDFFVGGGGVNLWVTVNLATFTHTHSDFFFFISLQVSSHCNMKSQVGVYTNGCHINIYQWVAQLVFDF